MQRAFVPLGLAEGVGEGDGTQIGAAGFAVKALLEIDVFPFVGA